MRKSTLLVVLLAAALGGGVWYFEFKREKPAEESTTPTKPLFSFKSEEVTALKLSRGGETLALEKSGAAWRLTQPLPASADQDAVGELLNSLSFGRISKTIPVTPPETPEKLKAYGLDSPAVTLEIKLKSGATHRLRLGGKDFMGSDVYALVDSAPDVALLPGNVLSSADKPVLEFRDRRIVVLVEENLVRIRVKNEHGTLISSKNAKGKWLVADPVAMKGREAETGRIISALVETRALAILDSPTPADRARLAHAAVEVELAAKDGSATRVEFSGGKGDAYVRSSIGPMLFKVGRTVVDGLNFKPADVVKKEEPKKLESPAKKQN